VKRRKFLLGSTATLASASLLTGTGAFSSVEADRNVKVKIVSDGDAYLGLTEDGTDNENVLFDDHTVRTEPETFDIVNQSANALSEIRVSLDDERLEFFQIVSSDSLQVEDLPSEESVDGIGIQISDSKIQIEDLPSGESIDGIGIRISDSEINDDAGVVTDELLFEVDDSELEIEAKRTLKLQPFVEDVKFTGAGGFQFDVNANEPFRTKWWTAEEMESSSTDETNSSDDENSDTGNGAGGQGRQPGTVADFSSHADSTDNSVFSIHGNSSGGLGAVAVYLPKVHRSYRHPMFDQYTNEIDNWGQGSKGAVAVDGNIGPFE
jgi:hypothetical protein